MTTSPRRLALLALPLLPLALACPQARAQDAAPLTTEQSASLQRAVALWTAGFAGMSKTAALPYTVAPEGDHYLLTMSLPKQIGTTGVTLSAPDLTAQVRPLDGGRWAFADIRGFSPFTLVTPKEPGEEPLHLSLSVADQDGKAVIDPSLAAASSFDGKSGAVAMKLSGADFSAAAHMDSTSSHLGWQPAGSGRVNVSRAADAKGVAYEVDPAKGPKVTVRIRSVHTESHMTGFDPARLEGLVTGGLDFLRTIPELSPGAKSPAAGSDIKKIADTKPGAKPIPAKPMPQLTDQQRAGLHKLLDDVRGLYASTDMTMALAGIEVQADGHDVTLDKASFSQAFAAPDGKVSAHMRIVIEGLASPEIPPDIAHDFVPHRLVIAPRVAGLSSDAVFTALGQAIDDKQPDPAEMKKRGADLLAKGPVTAGFDEISFDIGPAQFNASGSVKVAGPTEQDVTGNAVIQAHGLSALIKRAHTDPLLKQATPVLIFLKGIGDEDDKGNVVWKVSYGQGKVLVNGTDMSQLVPHK